MSTATQPTVSLVNLYPNERIVLRATGGNGTFKTKAEVYGNRLSSTNDENGRFLDYDVPGKPASETEVEVYALHPDSDSCTYEEALAAIDPDPERLRLSQEQAANFAEEHPDKLVVDGPGGVFLPFTEGDDPVSGRIEDGTSNLVLSYVSLQKTGTSVHFYHPGFGSKVSPDFEDRFVVRKK